MPDNEFAKRAREQIATLMLGGFGLVAALAWNDAIQTLFNHVFGSQRNSLAAKFAYAVLVTLIAVFIGTKLNKLLKGENEKTETR